MSDTTHTTRTKSEHTSPQKLSRAFLDKVEDRFKSRKFLLSVIALVLVTFDVAEATEVAIAIGPFVGLEGIADAVERKQKAQEF